MPASPSDARREREGLCDTALAVGPDAPTLCAGWTVRDLVVHLLVRDSRPDVVLGGAVPPLRSRSAGIVADLSARPFAELVEEVRQGPRGPLRLGAFDELVNRAEFYVHHEDVRRAQPGWTPRELPRGETEALWRTVRTMGRLSYRRAGVGVVLVVPGGQRAVVRSGDVAVSVTGATTELVMHAFGRRGHANVTLDGTDAALETFLQRYPTS